MHSHHKKSGNYKNIVTAFGVPEGIRTPDLSLSRSLGGAFLIPSKSSKILDFTGFSEILVLIISLMKSANFTPFFPFILARY